MKQLSKDLKWITPYLEAVGHIVPLDKITEIRYYTSRKHHKKEHHKAITHRLANNKSFAIFLRTKLPIDERVPLRYYDQEDIMYYLAHELAHVRFWEHTTKHLKLTSKIFKIFTDTTHKLGWEEERHVKSK